MSSERWGLWAWAVLSSLLVVACGTPPRAAGPTPTIPSLPAPPTLTPTPIPPTASPVPPTLTPVPPTLAPPIELQGSGGDVKDVVITAVSRLHFTHQGARNFAVVAYGAGTSHDLLVNTIGTYDGTRYLLPGAYSLEITADGAWAVTISALASDQSAAGTMQGVGDDVRGLFAPPGGRATYQFIHAGERNFAVILVCDTGRDLLVNEIGAVDTKAVVQFGNATACFWDITADGAWGIAPA